MLLCFSLLSFCSCRALPDDPAIQWSTSLISSLILKSIRNYGISVVGEGEEAVVKLALGLGRLGLSSGPTQVVHLVSAGRLPEGCQIFSLHSVNLLRKYLSVLELPISWLLPSDFCCVIGQEEYKRAKKAMLCHRSQLLWFRRLYIFFSRYMFVNTFQAITMETKNVKIY
ncbi:N-acetylglucosaminyl-phosphatidylinositol de-N-acetylase [Labeo rohita]|uniref:N-acetylglucosaminylphosphatidylinositol deacetylase n=1 Tax=Labeo rohita TaxID=84645 RepID=A0ABQ8MNQ9_LABRO|nr:N-acetylglucosaminyl-phosphatidylinositol de-N-acetylase [Labeo rohita]